MIIFPSCRLAGRRRREARDTRLLKSAYRFPFARGARSGPGQTYREPCWCALATRRLTGAILTVLLAAGMWQIVEKITGSASDSRCAQ